MNQEMKDEQSEEFSAKSEENSQGKMINSTDVGNCGKMFVGGLSRQTTNESLRTYFEAYGAVKDVSVKVDPNTHQSRGFGFVLFVDESSIDEVAKVGQHNLDGKKIDPKKAERRDGKMFVGGVKGDTTDQTIHEYFSAYGEVESVDRPVDKATGKNKGFCFVTFKRDGIMRAVVKDRYHEIDGKRCEAKEGVPKQEMNHQNNYGNYYNNYGAQAQAAAQYGYGYSGAYSNQNYGSGFNGPPVQSPNFGGQGQRWNGNFGNNGWNPPQANKGWPSNGAPEMYGANPYNSGNRGGGRGGGGNRGGGGGGGGRGGGRGHGRPGPY